MNKGGLVAEVSKRTGLSKADVGRVVDATIDAVRDSVVRGERVTLADFGTFERKHRNERIARNPRRPQCASRMGLRKKRLRMPVRIGLPT